MKATVDLGLSWIGWEGTRNPKSLVQIAEDHLLVHELLEQTGFSHVYDPEQPFYEIELSKDDPRLAHLFERLQSRPDLVGPWIKVSHRYSNAELESAPLLSWFPTNQAVEDDAYALHPSRTKGEPDPSFALCPVCGGRLQQRRNLRLKRSLMGARDLSATYARDIIVSERVQTLFAQHGITGADFRPVDSHMQIGRPEPNLFQLTTTHVLQPMRSPPTEFQRILKCAECGNSSRYLKHTHWWSGFEYREDTPIYYQREAVSGALDVNATCERFGEPHVACPFILISQRLHRLLKQERVKNWDVVPVHIVE